MEISTNGLIFSKLVPSEILAEANVKELRFLRKATESLVQQAFGKKAGFVLK